MRLHIAHESSADALPHIAAARRRGVDITVETCPQYLLLTDDDVAEKGGVLRCNPPIRKRGHDTALWHAIDSGLIDILTTDHAPHSVANKSKANIWENSCGLLGVETSLPLMLTQVHDGRLTLEALLRLCATNPAKVWDLYPRKGICTSVRTPILCSSTWREMSLSIRVSSIPSNAFRAGMDARYTARRFARSCAGGQ